jgi:hypothetical protein
VKTTSATAIVDSLGGKPRYDLVDSNQHSTISFPPAEFS